jgi:rhodanese-related sulfurtransferase
MAGFVIENIVGGKLKSFHWHDVENLPRDAIRLDVRTAPEFARGSIGGFTNIPLDELRNRISELDRAKTVYVCCQIGLRGYLACRILSQRGFDCYNLSGGYRLYRSICPRVDFSQDSRYSGYRR